MNHPRLVRRFQRLGNLLRNRQRVVDWNRALRDTVDEGRPLDQLQDQRAASLDLVFRNAVDGGDVRVVEAGQDLGFPLEPGEAIRISREGVGEDLQRDLAVELGVGGLPDLAHAALANEGGHVIVPEAGASGQGHESVCAKIGTFYAQAVTASSNRRGPLSPTLLSSP